MSEMVEISFKYSKAEFVLAMREYYAKAMHLRTDIFAGAAGLVAGYFLDDPLKTILMVAGVILLGIVILAYFALPRIRFRSDPKFQDEYALQFAEEGIHFKTEHIDSKIKWEIYKWVWETKHFYFLIASRTIMSIIPKRALSSPESENSFKELLKRKIASYESLA